MTATLVARPSPDHLGVSRPGHPGWKEAIDACREQLTTDELHMLAHVRRWMGFGGADDDIFLIFGISPYDFYSRMSAVLDASVTSTRLGLSELREIRSYCSVKRRQYQGRRRHSLVSVS